jgi:DNA-binding Xre family transcriptional regulator
VYRTTTQLENNEVNARVVGVLRDLLATRDVTPAELADVIGVDASAFSRRMSGEVPWLVCEVAAVCAYLRVPLVL